MARNGAADPTTKKLPRVLNQPDNDMWLVIEPILTRAVALYEAEAREQQRDTLVAHPLAMTQRFLAQCGRMLPPAKDDDTDPESDG